MRDFSDFEFPPFYGKTAQQHGQQTIGSRSCWLPLSYIDFMDAGFTIDIGIAVHPDHNKPVFSNDTKSGYSSLNQQT